MKLPMIGSPFVICCIVDVGVPLGPFGLTPPPQILRNLQPPPPQHPPLRLPRPFSRESGNAWSVVAPPMSPRLTPRVQNQSWKVLPYKPQGDGSFPVILSQSVSVSMEGRAARQALHASGGIAVDSVVLPSMEPSSAQPDNVHPIVTKLRHEVWSKELAGAPARFAEVPTGLRYGFTVGLENFTLSATCCPPNYTSSPEHDAFLQMKYQKELDLGRISPAFTRSELERLIGPFRTAPLSVVESANKLRVIVDHSFPDRNSSCDVSSLPLSSSGKFILDASKISINSVTDLDKFKCDWGTFHDCILLVAAAPPGSQAAVFDVDSAFRNLPLHPDIQKFFVIRLLDKFHLDYCLNFGHSPSPAVWGLVADVMVWILKNHGVEALLKWVDDFVFFRYPISGSESSTWTYSYDESLIRSVAEHLGWPWAPEKCFPFSFEFKYVGFLWNLTDKTVQLPHLKKEKYLDRLAPWVRDVKQTVRALEKIIGTLNHVCLVAPHGRSYMQPLYEFRSSYGSSPSPFASRSPPKKVLAVVDWWRHELQKPFLGFTIFAPPPPLTTSFTSMLLLLGALA
jgi:hypothetical protein